ncbi:MAG: phosphatidylserine decarboxylase [Gammaproteobacteria bacterium]|nr:phosphatidylserine decarboxylase [Gammaproteobacteria bacterium]MBT7877357.1 phosphatidylserine decarboxylase [Gammaproteobacteria bacterium]
MTRQPDSVFAFLQRLIPKHLLSRIVGSVAKSESPLISSLFINIFCMLYRIDLGEAQREKASTYRSFNDFFTRSLKPGMRTIQGTVSSPADGTVAALGNIDGNTLIQSKNHSYSLAKLLASNDIEDFARGSFITIYLAPHNYHRVHVPWTGELHHTTYVPGDLFSVNQSTALHLPDLFARNERLVCRFRTDTGPTAAVLVGAMLVAGIKPVWLDEAYTPRLQITTKMKRVFQQGDELGQFEMGSTVILVFKERMTFSVKEGETVKYGQSIVS